MELNDYQQRAYQTDQQPIPDDVSGHDRLFWSFVGLSSEIGALARQYKKRLRDNEAHEHFVDRAADELGDCLWYMAILATRLGLTLDDIAQRNLQTIDERWGAGSIEPHSSLFDNAMPEEEQLPRTAWVKFEESRQDDALVVRLWCDGRQLGNDLRDMSWDEDGYRFHDAFHLTYAAMLGWSPITRSFFRRGRRSNQRLKEVEDSGRAKVIEEGIAALMFEYARAERWLQGVSKIDLSQLRTIRRLVSGLEVRVRTVREWEQAILRSFEIWRALRKHGGGFVHLDLVNRRIDYQPPHER